MDIFSFWKCIESSIQDMAELAPYLPVGKVSEQKQEYIQNKDVLLIHWTETWRSKEKQKGFASLISIHEFSFCG